MNISVSGLSVTDKHRQCLRISISTCHPGRLSAC